MMTAICAELHNYFVREIRRETYTITGGKIALDWLRQGQYFRILGSIFNDGVYRYDDALTLTDEEFVGEVWAMAVPPELVAMAQEIADWQSQHGSDAAGPYTSESWGGYSYSIATNAQTGQAVTWQDTFRRRLNAWRKI